MVALYYKLRPRVDQESNQVVRPKARVHSESQTCLLRITGGRGPFGACYVAICLFRCWGSVESLDVSSRSSIQFDPGHLRRNHSEITTRPPWVRGEEHSFGRWKPCCCARDQVASELWYACLAGDPDPLSRMTQLTSRAWEFDQYLILRGESAASL
jgi:hypothetical protein